MSKNLEQRLQQVERRLVELEKQPTSAQKRVPPWLKHGGWAKGDAVYDEALRLGAAWRKRQNRSA